MFYHCFNDDYYEEALWPLVLALEQAIVSVLSGGERVRSLSSDELYFEIKQFLTIMRFPPQELAGASSNAFIEEFLRLNLDSICNYLSQLSETEAFPLLANIREDQLLQCMDKSPSLIRMVTSQWWVGWIEEHDEARERRIEKEQKARDLRNKESDP
jgi:hypothetical protein